MALDVYMRVRYGNRRVTPLGNMMASDMASLVTILDSLHGIEWDRLWDSYVSEYNPIWNVDGTVTVTEERDLTQGHTGTNTFADTGTDTDTHSGTDTEGHTGNDRSQNTGTDRHDIQNNVNGFDSGSAVPESSSTDTLTAGTGTTVTHGETISTQHGEQITTKYGKTNTNSRNFEDTDKGSVTTTTKRGGNIGVTMTQQMLEADLEYWTKAKAQFYRNVMQEIIDDITYKITV